MVEVPIYILVTTSVLGIMLCATVAVCWRDIERLKQELHLSKARERKTLTEKNALMNENARLRARNTSLSTGEAKGWKQW